MCSSSPSRNKNCNLLLSDHLQENVERERESDSVISDSLTPHGLKSPWNFPCQNTGVGNLSHLQGIFPTQGLNPGLLHCRQILYQLSHSPQSPQKYKEKQILHLRKCRAKAASPTRNAAAPGIGAREYYSHWVPLHYPSPLMELPGGAQPLSLQSEH